MKPLALTPFHIYPPTFGGAERCWNLLSRVGPIDVIALNWEGHNAHGQLGDVNYQLISADDKAVDQAMKLRKHGVKTFDPMPTLTTKNLTTIRKAIDDINPDIVVLEHPWLLDLIDGRPHIYDAHNCETVNTAAQTGHNSYDTELVADIEKRAAQGAEHITYCSTEDIIQMSELFTLPSKLTHIPNGVTLPNQVSTGHTRNLIFIGSVYQPNVDAAQNLVNLAPQLPDYTIQILGGCANYVHNTHPNVQLVGPVNEEQMHNYFVNAYAFINITVQGSGTHLKIGRALAYGLPVITTPIGARGYTNTITARPDQIVKHIHQLDWNKWHTKALEEATTLTWDNIAQRYKEVLNEHM